MHTGILLAEQLVVAVLHALRGQDLQILVGKGQRNMVPVSALKLDLQFSLPTALLEESDAAKYAADCIEHRIVQQGLTLRSHRFELLESAEADAHSRGENYKVRGLIGHRRVAQS